MAALDDTRPMNALRLRRCPGNPLALFVAALALLATPGCGDSWARDRDAALMALDRGDDRTALQDAERLARTGPRSGRAQAAYIGGIAAYRLGEYSRALDLLGDAVLSDDPALRGRALVQRGTVEKAIGRSREAAMSFERGGSLLDGSLASDALLQAADAFKSIGLEADARRCLDRARRIGGSATGSGRVAGFTIQFGAFGSRENATKCARAVDSASRAAGLGSPQILRQDGLYKVQVGSYANLAIAGRALDGIRQTPEVLPTIVEIGN